MSLILDALHRSRQDTSPVPGLATHHPVAEMPVERRQFVVWVILAVALVVIAWLVMERFSAPPAAEDIGAPVAELSNNIGSAVNSMTTELKARSEAVAPPQTPPPTAQATPAPAQVAPAPAQAAPAPTQAAPATPQPVSTASSPTAAQAQPMEVAPSPTQDAAEQSSDTPALSAEETDAVAQLYQNRELQKDPVMPKPVSRTKSQIARDVAQDTSPAARTKQDANIDQILEQARDELENASLEDNSTPFLADLSQQAKDDIPTLYYQRHDYSSDPNASTVVLNGTTVKAGGSPLPGMKVEEILPDSVVLNYRGTQFRLRALNSWINL